MLSNIVSDGFDLTADSKQTPDSAEQNNPNQNKRKLLSGAIHRIPQTTMSLACLVCHGMESPSHSFRSHSVSSSDAEGRCAAALSCFAQKIAISGNNNGAAKVAPFPVIGNGQGVTGAPRLQRSRAVSRDLVRDWNFDEVLVGR
uniref:Uncharacterized protein n=1 Tax=Ananas comosus var. bracteatus TaxID=296719 RepID=A0A6V7Q6B2_ANACO|nr:unnamed protein product [Ananas comosus var. bracteatus]